MSEWPLSRLPSADGVAVFGTGQEGRAVLDWFAAHAPEVAVHVLDDATDVPDAVREQATCHLGPEGVLAAAATPPFEVLIRSPGVPVAHPALQRVRAAGVPVTTLLDSWLHDDPPVTTVGVTGTKGKSTASQVLTRVLRSAGRSVALVGNIGRPVLAVDPAADDVAVIELSSYVLADLTARLDVGVILNLYREHTDWHGSFDRYRAHKLRLLELADTIVANRDDPRVRAAVEQRGTPPARWFARQGAELRCHDARVPAAEVAARLGEAGIHGEHNLVNAAAALTAAAVLGVDPADGAGALAETPPLPHRLEVVHDDGRRWVDDSIATVPEATLAALGAFDGPAVLIAGGSDRGQELEALADTIAAGEVRGVAVLGPTGPRLAALLADRGVAVHRAEDLADAVGWAGRRAPRGGVVLLSPAAPSYYGFDSFEERGEAFAVLARAQPPPE